MSVTGDATRTARNDTARLQFRVTTRARTAANALDRNSARMGRVIAAIKAQGIPAADIETQHVSLSRVRIRISKGHHRHVYRAANAVRVTVRSVPKTGAVIQAGVDAGATGFSGPDLSYSKAEDLYRAALGDAFDEARAKAQELADRAGATLGPAVTITEGSDEFSNGGNQQNATSGGGGRVTPIEPGTTTVFAEVSVTFALE
ncbi:MAG TPA: SIMPL domain-containing protein [Thermoleophilaceae bacterium]|nr:SIMPL domain-containing protein [Thermoleophilaceae bacterium]